MKKRKKLTLTQLRSKLAALYLAAIPVLDERRERQVGTILTLEDGDGEQTNYVVNRLFEIGACCCIDQAGRWTSFSDDAVDLFRALIGPGDRAHCGNYWLGNTSLESDPVHQDLDPDNLRADLRHAYTNRVIALQLAAILVKQATREELREAGFDI